MMYHKIKAAVPHYCDTAVCLVIECVLFYQIYDIYIRLYQNLRRVFTLGLKNLR